MKTEDAWKAMNAEELEKQYSPSQWSKRLKPGAAEFVHRDIISRSYKNVTENCLVEMDVSYGPTSGQKIDLFKSKLQQADAIIGSPIFAFVHGGYWQMLNKEQGSVCVKPLVDVGCTVALVGYDLAPIVSMNIIVEQIQNAAKYLVDLAKKTKSSGVYFCGHSAGGHLVTMIATSNWLESDREARQIIKGYIGISGIYDLRPLVKTSVNEQLGMNEELAKSLSPVFLLGQNLKAEKQFMHSGCQFLTVVGENDSPEFKRQSMLLAKGLKGIGANSRTLVVPEVDHFDVVEKLNDSDFILTMEILNMILDRQK